MRKVNYRIRAAASEDLADIWEYTFKKWSKDQADRYHGLIISEIEYIAENDSAGKDMSHVKEDYLVTYVKSHMIFFKRQHGIVHVIRILHQRMDIESNLKKKGKQALTLGKLHLPCHTFRTPTPTKLIRIP